MQLAFGEEYRALPEALVWLATGDQLALEDAKRRVNNLTKWDVHGTTGFQSNDQAGISIAFTLALAYDWLYPELNEAERDRMVAVIAGRLTDILGKGPYGLDHGHRIDTFPYDSHGAVAMARVSAICTVMAGADPLFDQCFRDIVPRYLSRPVPWGGDDGGYANGTGYAKWDMAYTHLIVWSLLKEALSVDLFKTPWAKGYGRFITYFLPPGTPSDLFGDGAEQNWREVWATQAKAYAAFIPSPLADWYERQQFGEDDSQLALLLSPSRDWPNLPTQLPPGTPNGVLMPSIGWVAMHSDLSDRARTSIYFKSSPYSSFNHSHADQNGFVINARGRQMAIDSGYYDYYNSPHWKNWYKQTRAHNAVTFDGGQGQLVDTLSAKGRIARFETTPDYDMVTGDATPAYGGALSRAVRSMVYVRPGTLLVFDSLASGTPRSWEWNIHALKPMQATGERSVVIMQDCVKLCVDVLSGPQVSFSQTDEFTTSPEGAYPNQWHGRFSVRSKSTALHMLTMLSVNCDHPPVEMAEKPEGLDVSVGTHRFRFTSASVEAVQ